MSEPNVPTGDSSAEPNPPRPANVTRRDMLKLAGAGGLGLLLGSAGLGGVLAGTGAPFRLPAAQAGEARIPFHGARQAGIVTPAQNFICFASFDATTSSATELAALFKSWTDAAARMCAGQPAGEESGNPALPPVDTGEAAGLSAARATITFGVGPALFDDRFGLAAKRPEGLAPLPRFSGDNLRPEWTGGDIGVQVCADDLQVAFHAVRNLTRIARGVAVLRWTQEGFQRTGAAGAPGETPRNLLGFKDGTGNPDTSDQALMEELVWTQAADGPAWLTGGSYMAVRRIRMRMEVWDRSSLADQEATFGRRRDSGAPLGAAREFDPLPLEAKGPDGQPVVPMTAHSRLAHAAGKERILRRSYSYSSGIDRQTGQLDAGLLFISYQRDLRTQFIPIQQRLAKQDKLNEYITHVGSAVFACFPGAPKGGYIGQSLFEA